MEEVWRRPAFLQAAVPLIRWRAASVGAVAAAAVYFGWTMLTPTAPVYVGMAWGKAIVLLVATAMLHELLHFVALPSQVKQHKQFVLPSLKHGIRLGVAFHGEVSRSRLIVTALLPVAVLTVLPLVVASAFSLDVPEWYFVSISNAIGSMGDIYWVGGCLSTMGANGRFRMQEDGNWVTCLNSRPPSVVGLVWPI